MRQPNHGKSWSSIRPGVTRQLVAEVKRLHARGLSYGDISQRIGYSRATISLIVRDKYPCVITQ